MKEKEYLLLLRFVNRDLLTDVDPALRRAVKSMMTENSKLLEEIVTLGGKELARECWDDWASQID